jgi:molybdopterin biosynthesis enzyme MoaB
MSTMEGPRRRRAHGLGRGHTRHARGRVRASFAERLLREAGFDVVERRVVADERAEIERVLRELSDAGTIGLVVTTGGRAGPGT